MPTPKKPSLAIIGIKGLPFVYSGYETFVHELCARLADRYEIHVYCHRALFAARPRRLGAVHLHYLPAVETQRLTHLTHGLASTLHAALRGYDLHFYVNACHGPFGYLLRALGKASIINTDGVEWARPQLRGLAARYYRWAARQATRAFGTVVTDCEAMARVYRDEFGAASEVISYGANLGLRADERELDALGLAPDGYYLVVGRLIPDNNADLLLEGFLASGSRRQLVIVGDLLFPDAYAAAMRRRANAQVLLPGFVRRPELLRALFANAYCYLHGHEYGGINPTLLEAMARGCCVLALETPFNREVLLGPDAELGRCFARSAAAVAAAIQAAEADPLGVGRCRANAPGRIAAAYTWDRVAAAYDQLFQRVLARRGAQFSV